jgi:hypothetical protein
MSVAALALATAETMISSIGESPALRESLDEARNVFADKLFGLQLRESHAKADADSFDAQISTIEKTLESREMG